MVRADRRAVRREEIVSAAAELFAKGGYPSVGMDQIGAAAGITGPAIYRHFDSKAAVLAAVFDGIIDAVTAEPVAFQTASGDPGESAAAVGSAAILGPDGARKDSPDEASAGDPGARNGASSRPGTRANGSESLEPDDPSDPESTDSQEISDIDFSVAEPGEHLDQLIGVYAEAVAVRRRLMAVWVREVHHLPPEHRLGLEQRQRALVRRWRTVVSSIHPDWPPERVRTAVHAAFGMLNAVGTFDSPLTDAELTAELDLLARRALGVG